MQFQESIDDLIEAGWNVVKTEFDKQAYLSWKKKAYLFLADFVGPDHACTRDFQAGVSNLDLQAKDLQAKLYCDCPEHLI